VVPVHVRHAQGGPGAARLDQPREDQRGGPRRDRAPSRTRSTPCSGTGPSPVGFGCILNQQTTGPTTGPPGVLRGRSSTRSCPRSPVRPARAAVLRVTRDRRADLSARARGAATKAIDAHFAGGGPCWRIADVARSGTAVGATSGASGWAPRAARPRIRVSAEALSDELVGDDEPGHQGEQHRRDGFRVGRRRVAARRRSNAGPARSGALAPPGRRCACVLQLGSAQRFAPGLDDESGTGRARVFGALAQFPVSASIVCRGVGRGSRPSMRRTGHGRA